MFSRRVIRSLVSKASTASILPSSAASVSAAAFRSVTVSSSLLSSSTSSFRHMTSEVTEADFFDHEFKTCKVAPVTGSIGAEISDIDITKPLSQEQEEEVKQALYKYGVIFFRDQELTPETHIEFSKIFGAADKHPIVQGLADYPEVLEIRKEPGSTTDFGETFHSDNSYMKTPSAVSILHGLDIPPFGNDTVWSCQYLVFDSLSPAMQKFLLNSNAVHSAGKAFKADTPEKEAKFDGDDGAFKYNDDKGMLDDNSVHPAVRKHPETGKPAMYVNSMFTTHFEGMTQEESEGLLAMLFNRVARPEFQVRFRWKKNSVAIWDNRCVQHIAIGDNYKVTHRRRLRRVTIAGEEPQPM